MTGSKLSNTFYISKGLLITLIFCLLLIPFLLIGMLNNVLPVRASNTDTTIAFSKPFDVTVGNTYTETEPSIAINPVSPKTFLAGMNSTANLFALRLSVDEGKSWYDATLPPFAGPSQSDPVVGFNGDGKAYVTGISANGECIKNIFKKDVGLTLYPGGGVFVADGDVNLSSSNGSPGITWTDTITVDKNIPGNFYWDREGDPNAAFQDKPWLAIDTSPSSPFQNRVYLAWTTFYGNQDTIVWLTYSPGAGQPFVKKIPIAVGLQANGKEVTFASLAVGPAGDVYIAWREGPDIRHPDVAKRKLYMRHSSDGGTTFDPAVAIATDVIVPGIVSSEEYLCGSPGRILKDGHVRNDVLPSIAADPTNPNRVYMVWNGASTSGDSDIYLSFSDNKGSDWSTPMTVNAVTAEDQFMPAVTVDGLGTVYVEWYDRENDPANLAFVPTAAFSRNGGLTFVQRALNPASYSGDYRSVFDYLQISALPEGAVGIWVGDGDAHISIAKYVPAPPVDVYLIVDLSGSFSDDLPTFKAQAPAIITALSASNPNTRFGLGKFEDYPIYPFGAASCGDKAYERLVDLTFDKDPVLSTISGLFTRCGSDIPQSQLPALYQAATGAGQDLSGVGYPGASIPSGQQANFRDGATKLFILWTDASFHHPGDPGSIPYPGPSFTETVNAILALDPPHVIGISSGGGGRANLEAISKATGAVAPEGGVDCNGDGIPDIFAGEPLVCDISSSGEGIGSAIVALVEAASGSTPVDIDIKPGSDPNSINCNNPNEIIPVAILATDTFDALKVDNSTVNFEGATETHVDKNGEPKRHEEDVNGDGKPDLVFHFRLSDTGLTCQSTEGKLTGQTFDGISIAGTDSIRMVPK